MAEANEPVQATAVVDIVSDEKEKMEFLSTFLSRSTGEPIPVEIGKKFEREVDAITMKPNKSKMDLAYLADYAKHARWLYTRLEIPDLSEGSSSKNANNTILFNEAKAEEFDNTDLVTRKIPALRLNELAIPPPKFNGERPHPRRWLDDFEKSANANAWTDRHMIMYCPSFFTEAAHDWYLSMGQKKLDENSTWRDLRSHFVRYFLGEGDQMSIRKEIQQTFQEEGESVTTFMPRLVRLLQLAFPEKNEEELIELVKEKLRSQYQERLALQTIFTLEELNDCCRKIERSLIATREASRREYRSGPPRVAMRGRRTSMNRDTEVRRNMRDLTCYRCGVQGHIAPNCRGKPQQSAEATTSKNAPTKINLVTDQPASNSNQDEEEKVRLLGKVPTGYQHLCTISSANAVDGLGSLLLQKIQVNGETVEAVIDTGAYVSVVDLKLATDNSWPVMATDHKLVQAAGDALDCVGETEVEIVLNIEGRTKRVEHKILVVKKLCAPMLLGLALMRVLDVNINITAKNPISFGMPNKIKGVRVAREEKVPSRTARIIDCKLDSNSKTVAISNYNVDNSLMVANIVCSVDNSTVPVLVINNGDTAILIQQGKQIASFENVEEITERRGEFTVVNQVLAVGSTNNLVKVGTQLDADQLKELSELLKEFSGAFALDGELGRTDCMSHKIELIEDAKPFAEPMRRHPRAHVLEAQKQISIMVKEGVLEESSSPWASNYVIVRKKTGDFRLCVDYRKLNSLTKKNSFPLPNIESCLESLSGKSFFTQLDFASGYWQIPVEEKSRELTSFRTTEGLYQFKRMPFGLCNAPASFQKLINGLFAGLKGLNLQVFLDDVCLASDSWEEHLEMLKVVFEIVQNAGLKLKHSKCAFGMSEVTFLGHLVSKEGIRQDPEKMKSILSLPAPADVSSTRRVLGAFGYYRKFIKNFAMIAEPLTKLTRKNVRFSWTIEQQQALDKLKNELLKNTNLHHFNNKDAVMLKTDASYKGLAGILLQKQDGEWRLINCCSRRLSPAESNYSVTDLEGLDVVYTVTKFRCYLLGRPFQIITDHCALCSLNQKLPESKRLQRWALVLSEFDFKIVYMNGSLHKDVDCLSRSPVNNEEDQYLDKILAVARPQDEDLWAKAFESEEDRAVVKKAMDGSEGLVFRDNIVYKNGMLYVPSKERRKHLEESHASTTALHDGAAATLVRMEHLWWPGMANDVKNFVKNCDACQKRKCERALPAGEMHCHVATAPMEIISIDYMGPLAETVRRKKFVALCVDTFSKFLEAKAMETQSAEEFILFLSEICARYGAPQILLTDNAKAFDNALVKHLCSQYGIEHKFSAPHHSRGNAPAERALQSLQEKMSFALRDDLLSLDWELALPLAVHSINTKRHKSTGYAPFEIIFGRQPRVVQKQLVQSNSRFDIHSDIINRQLSETRANVISANADAQQRSQIYFDRHHRQISFDVDDLVLSKTSSRRAKLAQRFEGPFRVMSKDNDIYKVRNLAKEGDIRTRHVSHLKKYCASDEGCNLPADEITEIHPTKSNMTTSDNIEVAQPVAGRTRSKRMNSIGVILASISLFATMSIIGNSMVFREVAPILWTKLSDKYVSEGTQYLPVELYLRSPCNILSKFKTGSYTAPKFNRPGQVNPLLNILRGPILPNNNAPAPVQMVVTNQMQERWVQSPQGNGLPPSANGPILEPIPMPDNLPAPPEEEFEDEKRAKREIDPVDSAIYQCEMAFKIEITDTISKFREFTTARVISSRPKRQVGFVAGFFCSTILSCFKDESSSSSLTDRITLAEARARRTMDAMTTQQLINKAQLKTLGQYKQHIIKLDAKIHQLPEFSTVVALILDEMSATHQLLERLFMSTRENKPDMIAMSMLFNATEINGLELSDAFIEKASSPASGILHFELTGKIRSRDTHIWKVQALDLYTNLSMTPMHTQYIGKNLIVKNETNNCVRGIEDEQEEAIEIDCMDKDFTDPNIKEWRSEPAPMARTTLKHSKSIQVYPAMVVYCWGNKLIIRRKEIEEEQECPIYPFPISMNISFYTSDRRVSHVARVTKRSNTVWADWDVIHYHLNRTTDFALNSKMSLDRIEELTLANEKLLEETIVMDVKGSLITWRHFFLINIMICFAISIFVAWKKWANRKRKVSVTRVDVQPVALDQIVSPLDVDQAVRRQLNAMARAQRRNSSATSNYGSQIQICG